MNMRALTGLGMAGQLAQQDMGKPPEMPLQNIVPDPKNPRTPKHLRTPEEHEKQGELNADIRKRGIKSPISLRPHPDMAGKWIINFGHCRFEAAQEAGHETIPYFVDPNFDSFDQFKENAIRSDLTIWAVAEFIQRKLDEGLSKGEIADGLGKDDPSYVTNHLALVDAPLCLHEAYANGVQSLRTLYDLRRAWDAHPDEIDAWCASGARITRSSIQDLLNACRSQTAPTAVDPGNPPGLGHDQISESVPHAPAIASQLGTTNTQHEFGHDQIHQPQHHGPADKEALDTQRKFGHDQISRKSEQQRTRLARSKSSTTLGEIAVQYKGMSAKFAPNTTVMIVIAGRDVPLEVLLSDVEFIR
jgi:ParB family chromosome partitioning protein